MSYIGVFARFIHILIALSMALGLPGRAMAQQGDVGKPATDGAKQETPAATPTGNALKTGPVCDDRLLDELYMHIRGIECINTFDHSCWRFYAMVSGVIGSTATLTGAAAQVVDKRAQKAMSIAKHQIAKDNRLGFNSEQFKKKYAQFVDPKEIFKNGKLISKEQTRITALRSLERMSSNRSMQAVQAARSAAMKSVVSSGLRGGALMYAGALASGVGAALFVVGYIFSASPAGDCNDNGFAYIDYQPRADGEKGCEMSFSTGGLKMRGFFDLPREKQLATLLNDAPTCEYYHMMNEKLRGHLTSEIELMNQVSFKEVPTCHSGNGGVNYALDIAGETQAVRSRTDPETNKIRYLSLGQPNPGEENLKEQVRVFYQDSADGSRPYRVESTNIFNSKVDLDFEGFLKVSTYNKRYEDAIRTLNASQMWTPIVSSCCSEAKPEDCWKKKLPGLEKAMNEKFVTEKKGAAALVPGSGVEANPNATSGEK